MHLAIEGEYQVLRYKSMAPHTLSSASTVLARFRDGSDQGAPNFLRSEPMAKRAPKVLRLENWLRSSCGATGKDLLGLAALFVAGCDGAEVFQSVDRALNVIAAFVSGRIETWWRSASTAFS